MPHGHGDIHPTLQEAGLNDRWKNEPGHVVFIQDTAAQALFTIAAQMGVLKAHPGMMSLGAVGRVPFERLGIIAQVNGVVQNYEYNRVSRDDDALGKYNAGNNNTLTAPKGPYADFLTKLPEEPLPEIANPKADLSRTEISMQDMALKIQAFVINFGKGLRRFAFSTTKNNLKEAQKAVFERRDPESASSAEFNSFYFFLSLLDPFRTNADLYNHRVSRNTGYEYPAFLLFT